MHAYTQFDMQEQICSLCLCVSACLLVHFAVFSSPLWCSGGFGAVLRCCVVPCCGGVLWRRVVAALLLFIAVLRPCVADADLRVVFGMPNSCCFAAICRCLFFFRKL